MPQWNTEEGAPESEACMIIACPRCETTFSLPDEMYKPGKKVRCSQCGLVFPMPEPEQGMEPGPGYGEVAAPVAPARPERARLLRLGAIGLIGLALLVLLGYGGRLVYRSFSQPSETAQGASGTPSAGGAQTNADAEQARIDSIIFLDEIRQFVVDNVRIGKVMLIQGVAVNKSDSNKDYVRIRARLLDDNRQVLSETEQYCGVPLTLFQVQNLSEGELKEALTNRVAIMTNNTNIPPGGKTDFVVVFPNPPETVRRFEVRVTEVHDSPRQ